MTIKNGDKPASPLSDGAVQWTREKGWATQGNTGLTKREQFAAMMMQGFSSGDYNTFGDMASDAVAMADALLAKLEEK